MLSLLLLPVASAGFEVGSYGRVQVSSDLAGGAGDPVNVVAHGSRLEKDPYLELDFSLIEQAESGANFEVVITPALTGALFHYDGQWDSDLAVRNLYTSARGFSHAPLTVWAGSRMWRGDDVHLLDFWPLDDLNIVGGGAVLAPQGAHLSVAVGLNRLAAEEWQYQTQTQPAAGGVGGEDVLILDRQRMIAAVKAGRTFGEGEAQFRLHGYGEGHRLPEGARSTEDFLTEALPADRGFKVGTQLSAWGWGHDSYVHLWYALSTGLAAHGALSVPEGGFATDYTVKDARDHMVALAANSESDTIGLLAGAYVERFVDADANQLDIDDRWEATVALRPQLFLGDHVNLGLEASHQVLRPDGLNPRTDRHQVPQVTKLAVLPALSPGKGSFSRPQVRLQYIYSHLNDDAREWYAEDDVRHDSNHQHFVGVGAEWWVNSRSYR